MTLPNLPTHAAAEVFPMMGERELRSLAANIAEQGLLEPIVMLDGAILDGRNRYAACRLAGVEPRFREFDGGDPLEWVLSVNLVRRNLSKTQAPMAAARAVALYEDAAAARKAAGRTARHGQSGTSRLAPIGGNQDSDTANGETVTSRLAPIGANGEQADSEAADDTTVSSRLAPIGANQEATVPPWAGQGKAAQYAAQRFLVPTRSVERALCVLENGVPDLVNLVSAGAVALFPASEVAKEPHDVQKAVTRWGARGVRLAARLAQGDPGLWYDPRAWADVDGDAYVFAQFERKRPAAPAPAPAPAAAVLPYDSSVMAHLGYIWTAAIAARRSLSLLEQHVKRSGDSTFLATDTDLATVVDRLRMFAKGIDPMAHPTAFYERLVKGDDDIEALLDGGP